jgi:hypothetical protein
MRQRVSQARGNEAQVQRAVIDYLEATVQPRPFIFAIPNAAKREKGKRAGNAVPGLRKGMPDVGMLYEKRIYFLEAKADRSNARISNTQRDVILELGERGFHCCVFKSIDDVRAALKSWGVATRESKHV